MLSQIHEKSIYQRKQLHIQDDIKVTVITWNLQGMIPPQLSIAKLIDKILQGNQNGSPDIINIATQQCQRSLSMSFFCQKKQKWQNLLNDALEIRYKMVDSQTLQGLHSVIFVKKQLLHCYTLQGKSVMRAGSCNLLGNKGAVSLKCNILGQNIQFINCHLAANQKEFEHRNSTLLRIIGNMVEKDEYVHVFLCGDLNYRIDITKEDYFTKIKDKINIQKQMEYSRMLHLDQLRNQSILKQRFFPFYFQEQIKFPPTYKMNINNLRYNQTRIPGWTDRIFSRKGKIKQTSYYCMYNLYGSDHRPVIATFKINTQETLSIFPQQFVSVTTNKCQLI